MGFSEKELHWIKSKKKVVSLESKIHRSSKVNIDISNLYKIGKFSYIGVKVIIGKGVRVKNSMILAGSMIAVLLILNLLGLCIH